ncbi:MerR family transcriptional regulator [Rummeliibacillus stabekisii]|uniref:MerR family transcriptional regulator n=1 Tax=Rummeliibacillus stabekisii TaxID=241244 RepID=UPI0011711888|nr:MerR family transcriptional regulator [Rummeliibacillus stabekisii]MBB5171116.1 DNA-binding transcriptional MerR regulator [Rummeliibacillus stabekisii]GEL05230.1 putative HTH-type transcriptional regulator YyaN [Rummeliibacillus stabekisii]
MLTISQVSERTGLTPYTLRYYEKIGVLKGPSRREGGARAYSESEVSYIQCLTNLKKIGLSLEEITEFTREGCVMEKIQLGEDPTKYTQTLNKRTEILSKYLMDLEAKQQELEHMISLTKEKLSGYFELSKESNEVLI